MSTQKRITHSVQSIIDNRGEHYDYKELFSGENGSLNAAAIKPFYCGSCRQARVKAVPSTPNTRAYIALIDASKSDHTENCAYDYTKNAESIYSGTTYTKVKDGKYVLDLFDSPEALARHLAQRPAPVEVDEDYRHLPRNKVRQIRALRTYIRTIADILRLLQDFNYSPEIAKNLKLQDKVTGKIYNWEQIYYDLTYPEQVASMRKFLLKCHKSDTATPPLIVIGKVKAIWPGPKYVLTTSYIEEKQGLQVYIWPPYRKQPPSELDKGNNILLYGVWKLYTNKKGNGKPVSLGSGAYRATYTWSVPSQLMVLHQEQ